MAEVHGSIAATEQVPRARSEPAGIHGAAKPRGVLAVGLLAAAGPLLLYLRTMAPTVYGLDSAELSAGAYVLGIVHSPGSPTYLLLGHLFTWLPFGDVGYRVNLLSACAAAAAAGCAYAVLWNLIGDRLQALAGSWYLATTYYIWANAVAAELYALHLCFVAGLIWLGLRWREEGRFPLLYLFSFLFGLGLGGHLSLSVLAPGFALLIAGERTREWRPRVFALAAGCGLLGASVYLYLPLRAAAGVGLNYARDFGVDVTTWNGFWWMVSGQMFAAQLFGVAVTRLPLELAHYFYRLWSNFLGLGCFLGLVGVVAHFRRCPEVFLALAAMWLAYVVFVVAYDVPDKDMMLAPTLLIWAIWVTVGAQVVARWVSERTGGVAVLPAGLLLLLMGAANLVANYRHVDISSDWSARQRGELLLAWLPPQTLYLATWADAPILDYFQHVERRRLDVSTVNAFLVRERQRRSLVAEHLGAGLPVYATQPGLVSNQTVISEHVETCDCYRITVRGLPQSFVPPPPRLQCQPAPAGGLPPEPLARPGHD